MASRRVLMACPNHWESTFQVGSHSLARAFARLGWEVAFVSDPISPLHFAFPSADLKMRLASYRAGGRQAGGVWNYVPAAALTPHNKPLLRSGFVHRHWHRMTFPSVIDVVRRRGFGSVDLLYVDSTQQSFWLDAIDCRRILYRATDFSPHFAKATPASLELEAAMARRDLVVYPSPELQGFVESMGARRSMLFPNGVEYDFFAAPRAEAPPEYAGIEGPIAVYVGVLLEWFHYAWIRQAAEALPEMTFVLIGPEKLAAPRLAGLPNVRVLGCRPYAQVPAYLQHADIGLMPFDVSVEPDTVNCLNPLKMYQYFACGLPVVSSSWESIRRGGLPVTACATLPAFVAALRDAAANPGDAEVRRQVAIRSDWTQRVREILDLLDEPTERDASRSAAA